MIKLINFYNFIVLPVSYRCNLRCKYCFEHNEKEKRNLSIYKLKKLLNILNEMNVKNINLTFHGGEPLLRGKKFYENIFKYIQNKKYKKFTIIFQTNGTLIDSEYIKIFKKYDCNIGVSLDGNSYELNKNRFDNIKIFDKVLESIKILKENDIHFSLFITLTSENVRYIDDILNFINYVKPKSFVINPIKGEREFITKRDWEKTLMKCIEFYKKTKIPELHSVNILRIRNEKMPYLCTINGTCNKFLNMDINGNIYKTCIFQYKKLYIGNIFDKNIIELILDKTKFNPNISDSLYCYSKKIKK